MASPPTSPRTSDRAGRWSRLNIATTVLWREQGVVQLELGDRRVVVRNVGPGQLSPLLIRRYPGEDRPAGGSTESEARSQAGRPTRGSPRLTERLHEAGLLIRAGARDRTDGEVPAYLAAEFGAMVGRFGDDAATTLARRRRALVAVQGASRISATLAATLAAAGVGRVQLLGTGEASAADNLPGGLTPDDEGGRFSRSGHAAIRRASPDVSLSPSTGFEPADLVVLTDAPPVDPAVRDALHLERQAHLAVSVEGSRAIIGPLVLPGRTSCLRCADLIRSERDPAWPLLAVQLASRPRHARAISDTSLSVATAGAAAGQVLGYLDRQEPETLGGTIEWHLPDWRLRRRSWPAHPDCDCGAAGQNGR